MTTKILKMIYKVVRDLWRTLQPLQLTVNWLKVMVNQHGNYRKVALCFEL